MNCCNISTLLFNCGQHWACCVSRLLSWHHMTENRLSNGSSAPGLRSPVKGLMKWMCVNREICKLETVKYIAINIATLQHSWTDLHILIVMQCCYYTDLANTGQRLPGQSFSTFNVFFGIIFEVQSIPKSNQQTDLRYNNYRTWYYYMQAVWMLISPNRLDCQRQSQGLISLVTQAGESATAIWLPHNDMIMPSAITVVLRISLRDLRLNSLNSALYFTCMYKSLSSSSSSSSSSWLQSTCGPLHHSTVTTVNTGVPVVTRRRHSDISPDLGVPGLLW